MNAALEDCDISHEVDLLHLIVSEYFRFGLSGSSVYDWVSYVPKSV